MFPRSEHQNVIIGKSYSKWGRRQKYEIHVENRVSIEVVSDHRIDSAHRKREQMRGKILAATIRVFARINRTMPVIEDVVREANISRGTFYNYFVSLDEALIAAGVDANNRMIFDIIPIYDFLLEPWQRTSVGFRLFMVRAWQDPKWAAFLNRMETWPHEALIADYMHKDLVRGKELGHFHFDDAIVARDFLMGASAGVVQKVRNGVENPHDYIESAVRMALQSVGCTPELRDRAVEFSRNHISACVSGERAVWQTLDSDAGGSVHAKPI